MLGDRWYERAVCRDIEDPSIFNGEQRHSNWRKARRICASCPVQIECLIDALSPDEIHPWRDGRKFAMFQAGLTPKQLTQLYNARSERKAA